MFVHFWALFIFHVHFLWKKNLWSTVTQFRGQMFKRATRCPPIQTWCCELILLCLSPRWGRETQTSHWHPDRGVRHLQVHRDREREVRVTGVNAPMTHSGWVYFGGSTPRPLFLLLPLPEGAGRLMPRIMYRIISLGVRLEWHLKKTNKHRGCDNVGTVWAGRQTTASYRDHRQPWRCKLGVIRESSYTDKWFLWERRNTRKKQKKNKTTDIKVFLFVFVFEKKIRAACVRGFSHLEITRNYGRQLDTGLQ